MAVYCEKYSCCSHLLLCTSELHSHTDEMQPEVDKRYVLSLCSLFSNAVFKCIPLVSSPLCGNISVDIYAPIDGAHRLTRSQGVWLLRSPSHDFSLFILVAQV